MLHFVTYLIIGSEHNGMSCLKIINVTQFFFKSWFCYTTDYEPRDNRKKENILYKEFFTRKKMYWRQVWNSIFEIFTRLMLDVCHFLEIHRKVGRNFGTRANYHYNYTYPKTLLHSESKERLGNIFVLRYGVQHLQYFVLL
jgi:hypothetical protein